MNGISAFRSSISCKKNKKLSWKALNQDGNEEESEPRRGSTMGTVRSGAAHLTKLTLDLEME
jgi:hypothetical protein